ncbi:MAG TPA: hypothetical protein VFH47_09185 [Candidatus Thermoplasmatota archaeon]|nr:hypothetical protein [Candidatus Thermoplasmatota archaeon]
MAPANRRLAVALLFTIPLVAVAMGPHVAMLLGFNDTMDMGGMEGMGDMEGMEGMEGMDMPGMDAPAALAPKADMSNAWLQMGLAAPVVFYSGGPFFAKAWAAFRARRIPMEALVAIGAGTAFAYSALQTVRPDLQGGGLYFETAAVIVTLVLVGRRIEAYARRRATRTLHTMLGANQAMGSMLEETQATVTQSQKAVDRLVHYYVPIAILVAFLASAFWMTTGAPIAEAAGISAPEMAVMSFVGVLIIACPCALGLASPFAVLSGTSAAAQRGILIRSARDVELAARLDTIYVLDGVRHDEAGLNALRMHGAVVTLADTDAAATIQTAKKQQRIAVVGLGVKHRDILAASGLGIAIAEGDDLSKQAGGIIVTRDGLAGAAAALDIASRTTRKLRTNLALAFAFNAALVPIAAGLFVAWPAFGEALFLDPMYGAAAMTISLAAVALSSSMRNAASAAIPTSPARPTT